MKGAIYSDRLRQRKTFSPRLVFFFYLYFGLMRARVAFCVSDSGHPSFPRARSSSYILLSTLFSSGQVTVIFRLLPRPTVPLCFAFLHYERYVTAFEMISAKEYSVCALSPSEADLRPVVESIILIERPREPTLLYAHFRQATTLFEV